MSVDTQSQQSELKRLIIKGKEQGFLTYREINDHLPEDMNDTDQIETVVNMINDLGIEVYDAAPDADTLLLKTANSDDEEVVEEAEAVLTTAVESEFGRTTDPVRMYMREMGTVELLTRQDEIRLAKRIEDGIRQSVSAMASAPVVVTELVSLADNVENSKMKLTELLVGFVDLAALETEEIPQPVIPVLIIIRVPMTTTLIMCRKALTRRKRKNVLIEFAKDSRVWNAARVVMGLAHHRWKNIRKSYRLK